MQWPSRWGLPSWPTLNFLQPLLPKNQQPKPKPKPNHVHVTGMLRTSLRPPGAPRANLLHLGSIPIPDPKPDQIPFLIQGLLPPPLLSAQARPTHQLSASGPDRSPTQDRSDTINMASQMTVTMTMTLMKTQNPHPFPHCYHHQLHEPAGTVPTR